MDDQRLLKLAAKAAGFEGDMYYGEPSEGGSPFLYIVGKCLWNPLGDDGDALRLAVKLKMQIAPGSALTPGHDLVVEYPLDDVVAATRRAIEL